MSSCNLYLVFGPLNQLYISEHVCEQWFLFLIISGCILMATLDFLLMLRGTIQFSMTYKYWWLNIGSEFTVYALHLKDKRVAAFLMVIFFSKITLLCLIIPRIVFHVPYDPICDTAKTHPDVIYFS